MQLLSSITRLKLFLAGAVFTENTLSDAVDKFLVADIISGASDAALDANTINFQATNPIFPFCAYSYDFTEKDGERTTHLQRSGKYFDSTLGAYVSSKTVKNKIPFIFFFNNPKDYFTAQKIIHSFIASPSMKLDVPIIVNSVTYAFTLQVTFEIEKGTYSSSFQEYLRQGPIFDIGLNCEIEYTDITLSTTNIYPVDDMIATLYQMSDIDDSFNVQVGQATAPNTPAITSSIPINNATGVARNTAITINFTASMDVSSVIDALSLTPYFQYTAEWNDAGTELIITPVIHLLANTLYNVIILDSCFGFYNNEHPETDLELIFSTGSI